MQKNQTGSNTEKVHDKLSLKIHIVLGIILLLLAFLGVLLTSWQNPYIHAYWLGLVFVYALSSLGLSWFSHSNHSLTLSEAGRELLHWFGLIVTIYLVEHFKQMGLFSTPISSLVELLLLALTTFLAGVHFNSMFLLIGLFLGLIALLSVIIFEYLSFILLPILIVFIVVLWWQMYRKYPHKKT